MNGPERGQVVPLLAVFVAFGILLGAGIADVAVVASGRARAQTAADAAALAGAAALVDGADPGLAVSRMATVNGASRVGRMEADPDSTSVEVDVVLEVRTLVLGLRRVTATARAAADDA